MSDHIPTDDEIRNNDKSGFVTRCAATKQQEGMSRADALAGAYTLWRNYTEEK